MDCERMRNAFEKKEAIHLAYGVKPHSGADSRMEPPFLVEALRQNLEDLIGIKVGNDQYQLKARGGGIITVSIWEEKGYPRSGHKAFVDFRKVVISIEHFGEPKETIEALIEEIQECEDFPEDVLREHVFEKIQRKCR